MVNNPWNGNFKHVNSNTFSGANVTQYWGNSANRSIIDGAAEWDVAVITVQIRSLICSGTSTTSVGCSTVVADYHLTSGGILTLINSPARNDVSMSGIITSVTPSVYSTNIIQLTLGTWGTSTVGLVVSYLEMFRMHYNA
jgi:hypothetical protein